MHVALFIIKDTAFLSKQSEKSDSLFCMSKQTRHLSFVLAVSRFLFTLSSQFLIIPEKSSPHTEVNQQDDFSLVVELDILCRSQ